MSLKSLLKLAENYLRKHPTPAEASVMGSILKLAYIYSTPFSNSKNKSEVLYPLANLEKHEVQTPLSLSLAFDEKNNKIEQLNSFESICTEEAHEKMIQDDVFGRAKRSKNGNRWVYIAKEKVKKPKSYFLGGKGKAEYEPDFGETYDDITRVGIFIWDISLKKVFQVKIELESGKYVPACPIFQDEEGTRIIFHAYERTEFGQGLLHCFNRPIKIFEAEIEQKDEEFTTKLTEFKTENKTNIFPNVSPCFQYLVFFGGEGITHTYDLDLFIFKKEEGSWKNLHRIPEAAVGYYDTLKLYPFMSNQQPFIFYQTLKGGVQQIMKTHLESGKTEQAVKGECGQSYSILEFLPDQGLTLGKVTSHNHNSFFYLKNFTEFHPIPPLNSEEFTLHEYFEPIHAYFIEGKAHEEFQKDKKPLIVLIHGGPHGSSDPCLTMFRYMLLKCGYCILIPNFSGSAGYGKETLNRALGNIGKTDGDEIISLLEKVLKEREYIDGQRVHAYGGSYGGYMSAIMGSRYEKYFKSAVILNGVLSIPANLWFTDIPEWNTVETLKTESIHELKEEDYA